MNNPSNKTALLLVNLGSPDAPTPAAVRRYLREFLWDPRVVDLPRLPWWLILHGIILNTRPAKSAAKYAQIWEKEGSPLKVHTERQAKLVRGYIGTRGVRDIDVAWAMRYGQPSIPAVLDDLAARGCTRVLVVPLYPQHAGSTTASVIDAIEAWQRRAKKPLDIRSVPSFPDHPGYIAALAASVRHHWEKVGPPAHGDRLLMSFHGIPKRMAERGDPYPRECERTAQALAQALGLGPDQWQLVYQSRFGRAEWLRPFTQETLEVLGKSGARRVDVLCPGFVADCLETLEEIAIENRQAFLKAGGGEFNYIPCLNENHPWIEALVDLALHHLGDWLPAGTRTASVNPYQLRPSGP